MINIGMKKEGFNIAFAIGQIGPKTKVVIDQVSNKNVVNVLDNSAPADGRYGKLDVFFEG
jgi:hypothetical protein